MMFRDQVGVLAGWFKGWNECEQTVALLSLLKRVSQTQARFLQLCLEHSLADCAELHVLEGEANSPGKCAAADVLLSGPPSHPELRLPSLRPGPRPCSLVPGDSKARPPGPWHLPPFTPAPDLAAHLPLLALGSFAHCKLLQSIPCGSYGSMND